MRLQRLVAEVEAGKVTKASRSAPPKNPRKPEATANRIMNAMGSMRFRKTIEPVDTSYKFRARPEALKTSQTTSLTSLVLRSLKDAYPSIASTRIGLRYSTGDIGTHRHSIRVKDITSLSDGATLGRRNLP